MNGVQTPLGVTDPTDEAGAWVALKQLIADVGQIKAAVGPAPGVKAGRIPALTEQFLAEKAATVEPATLRAYRQHLDWLTAGFPLATAADLDPAAVVVRAGKMATWGDTHRGHVLATAAALLKWAGRPVPIQLPPKVSRGADSVIPDEVYRRCLVLTTGDFRQLLRFMWLTGCRPAEATGLSVDQVDWQGGTATLKQHKSRKKGKTRILFLGTDALAVLREQREVYPDGLLFRGMKGKRIGLHALTKRFIHLSAKLGRRVTSYQFRHTWATRALTVGVPDAQVAACLGHSSTAMIHRHYSHIANDAKLLKEVANRVAG